MGFRSDVVTEAELTVALGLDAPTGVLIPLYVYPANVFTNATYNGVIDIAKAHHRIPVTVVLNPSSGPGEVVDGNYSAAIRRLQGASITVLGYVHASYAARSSSDIQADIDVWLNLYPVIDGIFIDEMTNDDSSSHRALFADITRYAHSKKLFPVIGNPGAGVGNTYFNEDCADIIVVYESDGLPDEPTMKGDYDGGYMDIDYRHRAALVYNVTQIDPEQPNFITSGNVQVVAKYVGLIYVTPSVLPNPWDTLNLEELSGLFDTLG
jgi:Spherulation-specific family 4